MSLTRFAMNRRSGSFAALLVLMAIVQCTAAAVVATAQFASGLQAEIELYGIGRGNSNAERVHLGIEEEPTGRLIPLLPYIFFDDGSSQVPARYTNADSGATPDPFVCIYRTILHVVADRMRAHPSERLVLTGASSMVEGDRRTPGIARKRAAAIAEYLATTFNIARTRLIVRQRGLPVHASNNNHDAGRAENRRVELSGSDVLLAPIAVADSLARVTSTGMRILPTIIAPSGMSNWQIEFRHDGGLFRRLSGALDIRQSIDEVFTESELRRFAASPTGIDVSMSVRDAKGDSIVLPRRTILFDVARTRRVPGPSEGRPQDRESIVLYDFDSAELRPDTKTILLDLIARIPATSQLSVTGFTDETGDSVRNTALSNARADAVASALPGRVASARGAGESGGHHWNTLPEDRYYSRVARVMVR